jgi:hypothetical protein
MACESDQWNLTYQLSRSHDQGGRKLPPQKLMCGSFRRLFVVTQIFIFFSAGFVMTCQYLPRWLDKRFTSLLTTHRVFPMTKNRLETRNIWRGSKTPKMWRQTIAAKIFLCSPDTFPCALCKLFY